MINQIRNTWKFFFFFANVLYNYIYRLQILYNKLKFYNDKLTSVVYTVLLPLFEHTISMQFCSIIFNIEMCFVKQVL